MKIVFCGPACNQPNGEGSYAYHNMRAPLLEMGHDIIDVDFRAELAQRGKDGFARMVRDIVDREKPELFFHMVCEDELSPETVQYISAKTSTLAVAFFSDDDWRLTHSLSVVAPYNFGVTTASQAVPVYTKAGFTNVIFSQYAANPKLFHPIVGVAKQYDVTFVGQAYQGRPELVTWLKEQGLSIHVWGQGWERVPALRECSGGFLPQNEVLNVFAASRIVLGMSWTSDAKALQIKGRIFEYASAGVFQLSTYDARLADYFALGREIELYRDQTELLEKIRYYLVHDEERERIAQAGRARVLKDHTWTHRFEQLFEGMNRRLPPGKQVLRSTDGAPVSQPLPADAEHEPKVSIICTVLNGERYLDETIRSVLNLDYADWELILFDDGSTDGTRNIAMRHSHDPRIRYIYHTNIAQSGRYFDLLLNTCMEYVRGEYVAFIGADDNFMPEKLSVQLAAIEADPTIDLVFSDGMHIDASGRRLPSDFGFAESKCFTSRSLLRTLFKKNIVAHPTVLLRRDAIERLGGFETGFCPDYQFWLKAARFLRFAYIDKKLVQYRVHDQGVSTGKASKTLPETVKLLGMMRERVTIHDLYPELDACSDKSAALYSAYLHFGLLLAMANIPVPQQAILEWQRALEHRPDGIEAVNNIAVVLALMGSPEKAERWLKTRNVRFDQAPPAQENRSLLKQLVQGAKTLPKAFMFMSEDPEDSELLRRMDPPAQLEINRHYYGRLVAGIQSVKRASASTPAEPVRQAPVTQGPSKAESRRPASMPPLKPVQASTPLVSVIIPTVNRPQQLMEAVKSVLAQTLQDFEIIVVNDAGSEVEPLLAACSGSRAITYIRHGTNLERSATRNHGLKVARGKYIAYLDDDDRFLPHHLETLVGFLETHDYRVAYSDAWRVTQVKEGEQYREVGRDVPYSSDFNAQQLLITNYFPILSVVHERACLDEVGYFDESLSSHEDWDLWIRLSRRFAFAHIKQTTCEFTWRTDGSSTTSRNRKDFLRTAEIIYRKYRDISKAIPGVCELQAQSLQALREATEGKDRTYVCSIIIPVWNKVELTQQCVTALAEVTDEVDYEVIIVDNGSTDGTPAFLGQLSGDVHIIRNEENLGFSKACNQGAKAARGEFLVFLNNDTIPLKGWLSALVEEVQTHPDVAVVGSKLLYEDGTIQHAGVAFSREQYLPYHIYAGRDANLPGACHRREFKCVTAACMLVRREVFFSVGGFDEGYRNGFEDVDLCLQIGQQDWKIVYQPKSVLYHLESRTPGRKAHEKENSRRLLERWGHCWWLPDEDLIHFEDGYAFHTIAKDGKLTYRLEPITSERMRRDRMIVAEVQRVAQRQDREAVVACLKQPDEWPADVWILRWATLLCVGVGRPDLSPAFWQKVLLSEEDDRGRIVLAKAAIGGGDVAEAERQLSILLANHPDHGEGWLLRGVMAMQRQAYADAGAAFAAARRYGADDRKAGLGIVMAAVGEDRFEAGWETVRPLCEAYPDDEECLHWLLRCGTPLAQWSALELRLKTFVSRNPANLAMRFAWAGVLLRLGRVVDARAECDRIRLLDSSLEGLEDLEKQLRDAEQGAAIGHVA